MGFRVDAEQHRLGAPKFVTLDAQLAMTGLDRWRVSIPSTSAAPYPRKKASGFSRFHPRKLIVVSVVALIAGGLSVAAPTSASADPGDNPQTFAGDGTYTVPDGVTAIKIVATGAGGGGGASAAPPGGGAGGAGAVVETAYAVTPGAALNVKIGTGGTAGDAGGPGTGGAGLAPGGSGSQGQEGQAWSGDAMGGGGGGSTAVTGAGYDDGTGGLVVIAGGGGGGGSAPGITNDGEPHPSVAGSGGDAGSGTRDGGCRWQGANGTQSDGVSPTDVFGGGASRDCAAIDAQANPNDVLNAGVGVDGISDAGGDGFFGQGGNAAPSSGDEGTVGAGGGGAGYGGGGGGTYSPGQMGLGGGGGGAGGSFSGSHATNQTTVSVASSGAGVGGTVEGNGASGSVTITALNSPAITAVTGGNRQATVTWTEPESQPEGIGATTYKLYKNGVEVPGAPTSPATVTGLDYGETYSFTVVATEAGGTSWSSAAAPVTIAARRTFCEGGGPCVIGDTGPGGGIVFYDAGSDQDWGRYLEVAPSDWHGSSDPVLAWGAHECEISNVPGTSQDLGYGYANTEAIVSACPGSGSAPAAWEAKNYRGGDREDWFLPSSGELLALSDSGVGALENSTYWSSAQENDTEAWASFAADTAPETKNTTDRVRPIRAFIDFAPGQPTITGAVAGDAQVDLTWDVPSVNSVTTLTGYTVTQSAAGGEYTPVTAGSCTTVAADATSCTVGGLANGTDYTFKIAATSDHGTGSASEPSAIARPIGGPPDAPTIGETTVSGPNQLTVNWTNGADGGMSLSGYTVQASDNGGPMTTVSGSCAALTASATSCAVSGLTTGHTYTFQVAATNEGGTSAYSGVSAGVVALDGAGAPSITSITPGSGSLSIAFTAPTSDGGSAITNYEYSTDGGTTFVAASPATTTSPLVITNQSTSGTPALVNNTAYQVKLRAVNAAGAGAASPDSTATPNAPCSGTISYSAATQYCVVPDGVTSMQITAIGGAGGGGSGGGNGSNGSGVGGAGGKGAQVLTSQAVTPGAVLTLKTGGGGGGGGRSISGSYGYGGGTGGTGPASTYSGGGGGGGSTLVTGTGVEIVAGGGGGGSAGVGDPANTSITRNGATGGSAGSASGAGADGAGSTGAKGLGGVGGTGGAKPSNSGNQTAGTDGITGAGGCPYVFRQAACGVWGM